MSLMLDYLKKQDNAEPAATASKSSGSLMLDRLKELPAAAPSVPPSPVAQPLVGNAAGAQQQTTTASPVVQQQAPPVVPAVSAGRNAPPRVAPEDIQAPPVPEIGNQASDIDARIAANNAFASKVDDVLSPDLVGRNNTARFNTLAPKVGQDGVTPVSVFNPPSLSQQLLSTPNQDEAKNALVRDERQRLSNVMTDAGPTVEKANLNVNPTISGVDGVPGNYTIDILGTQVPVDDEQATSLMARGNTFKLSNTDFNRGLSRANQAMAFLGSALGMTDQSQAIKVVTELNRVTPDQPQELQDALREIVDADGWKDSLAAIASNPSAVLSVVVESLPMSATSLTAFIGGSIVGTPLLGATLAGTVTYGTVYQDVILSELREAGVDMNNNAAVQEMLSNPEFYERAKERAATYALPIAVFDALSMGLAGKLTGAVIKSGSKAPAIVAASVAELGMQGSLGASGEAAAQFMELERGFRDKISKGEIGLEFVAELVPGSVEVATGVYSGSQQSKQNRAQNEADAQEASAVDEIARGLLSSNNAQMTQVGAEPTGSLLLDAMQRAEEFSAPAAQPVVEPAVAVTQTTSDHFNMLNKKADEAESLAQQTDENIQNAEGRVLDLDSNQNEFLREDAKKYAADQRAKAIDMRKQAEELQQFFATSEGQRFAKGVEELERKAKENGNKVDFSYALKNIPNGGVDANLGRLATQLEMTAEAERGKAGKNPVVPNKPISEVSEVLDALSDNEREGVENLITVEEKQSALSVINPLIKQLNDMGFSMGVSLNPVNSTEEARKLKQRIIRLASIHNELGSQRFRQSKEYKNFKPKLLADAQARFEEEFGAQPKTADQTAAEPAVEFDPAAAVARLAGAQPETAAQTAAEPASKQSFTPLENLKQDYVGSEQKYVEPVANPDAVTDAEYNSFMAKAIKYGRLNTAFIVSNGIGAEKTKIDEVIRRADEDGILVDRNGIIQNSEQFASAYQGNLQDNPQAKPVIPFARPVADADGQQKTLTIRTPNSEQEVAVKPFIIELKDLKQAKGIFQPRDRSRKESDVGVRDRAKKLDPKQLMESPVTSFGAPIIARDGTIISGNGRVLSLELAKNEYPDQYANYKQAIEGYGASDQNYETPILVMMLDQDMTSQELSKFADISNAPSQAAFSVTEAASKDAKNIGVDIFDLYRPDSALNSMANQEFVNMFIDKAVTESERGSMTNEGLLTKPGMDRINAAILASAYNDTSILATFLEDTDNKVKSIGDAYLAAAPKLAMLKSKIENGQVAPEFDVTEFMVEAAQVIAKARKDGKPLIDIINQQAMFDSVEMAPETQALVRAFYTEDFGRSKSKKEITELLEFFSQEAQNMSAQGAGMFIENTTPTGLIEESSRRARAGAETRARAKGKKDDPNQGKIFQEADGTGKRSKPSGEQVQKPRVQRSGQGLKEADTASIKARLDDAERTRRAEADNQETLGTTEDSVLAVSDLDSQRTEKPGTLVDKMSMRRYSSLQGQAFVDAGIDPAIGKNMPIERQFKILSDLMSSKFGLAHVVKTDTANKKEAVDQLLAGYHNLNNLAYELGLPTQAMGLEGTLSFVAAADTGAYGTYSPSEQTITLPRRSNSFAHEWFHALDHYLLNKYGSGEATKMPLATEAVRKYGNEAFAPDAPINVKESYFALMRALFKDKATEAAQLMAIDQKMAGMEQRAAKSGKDVNAMPTYQKLKAQKQRILESTGKSKKVGKSQMRKDAEFFAEIVDQGVDYWASPAEMGARAFEAFAIDKVTNAGLQTAFLGKTDEGYTMTLEQLGVTRQALASPQTQADMLAVLDSRLALTFPKADERKNIFGAMQNLMDAIRVETELGQGDKAELIGNDFATDMRELHNVPEPVSKGILADYKQAQREAKNLADREKQKVSQYTERYKGKKKAIIGEKGFVIPMKTFAYIEDTVMAPLFYQKQGILKAMIKRYPNNRRLKRIYQKLGTHTGGELQSTYEGDTLFNAQARQVRIFSERMKNAVVGAEYNMFTQEEVTQLRDIMISEDNVDASPKVVKLAGQLRDIYNNMYDYLRSSGLDIGYAPNGYVQRILDHAEVSNDTAKFETQARKVYDIVWEQDLGVIDEGNLDQMLETIKYIQEARLGIEEFDQKTGEKITLGSRSDYKDFVKSTAWTDIKDLLGALKVEQKKDNPDQAQIDSLKAELKQQAADIAPKFEGFYNAMQGHFSRMKAINYRQSINHSHVGGSQDGSPQASFTKKRKLPPEADKLMEQFYISDPVENLTNYILGAVRKAEYNRRFGKHLIPAPASKNNYADALDYELKQLTDKDGITAVEVNEIESAISNMLGRNMDGKMPTMLQKGSNRAAAMLSVTLLIRAPIASIAEPFTVAMTTGSAKKGLMSFASTMQEFPGLRNLGNAQEDIRLRHQFARIMGIIDDPEVGDIMTNRIGGEFAGDPAVSRMMASFFAKIKLSGITNAQRRSAAKIGFQYITEMAYEIKNPSSLRNQKQARLVMQDLGVADSRMDQFVDYILSFNEHNDKGNFVGKMELPTADKVFADESGAFSDMGMQLAVSIMRFTDQSIQDPRTVDRPLWAENGIGRIVYGITSFIYSFQDKVLKPMARKTAREYGMSRDEGKGKVRSGMDAGTAAALNSAIPLATLFSAHALVSTAREYIFNQDRWDREWEEADEDELKFIGSYLLPLAFTRSGLTGAFDPLFQAFTGLKYQRDIANTFLGTGGYVVQNIQDIAKYWVNNSENTVSNEFKALRGIYNLTVNPIASFLLATSNLTPATAYIGTGAAMTVTSTDFKNAMINRWLNFYYGQTYTPGKGGRKSKSVNYTNK